MEKLPLDYKNACPDDIVDQLTNGFATYKGDKAVGFIGGTPAIFRWEGNEMRIVFEKIDYDTQSHLNRYVDDMRREQPEWIVISRLEGNSYHIRFYARDE